MNVSTPKELDKHILFTYISFDRVVLRGYIQGLFLSGSVIKMLRNLGFNKHSNAVLRLLTEQLNSHIKKTSQKLGVEIHWWGDEEKKNYHSKIDLIQDKYKSTLQKKNKTSKVIAIIRSIENVRTFVNKDITTKAGKKHTNMYPANKFVSQYYIYIDDEQLGLCYLKLSSYIPFVSEFYFNGHNYLKKQFDLQGKTYTMKDNSFTKVEDIKLLNKLIENFKPSIALSRVNYWKNMFFRFDKGSKSTCSKLLHHNWFTYQTEISSNIIFKSAKFANSYFEKVLSKHHTIGLPDKLTEIFSLSKPKNNSKTTQNKFKNKAVIKHWLEGNSIKCYNKSGCLLRVETTVNKPKLPGLKLKKPAINLMAYFRYGLSSNNRYIETIGDIDISNLDDGTMRKYQEPILNSKGVKVAAPDLRKEHQVEFLQALLLTKNRVFGFRNRDLQQILGNNWKTAKIAYELRKLRERGAVKKMKQSHYYQLTKEGYKWVFFSIFQNQHFVKPLMSGNYNKSILRGSNHKDKTEQAYSDIKQSVSIIMKQFALVS